MHLILIVEGILTTIIQYIKTSTYQRNINKKLKSINHNINNCVFPLISFISFEECYVHNIFTTNHK